MPRLIDHEERDRDILAAAFTVLERDGLAGLSVRGIAAEAGIATASLRRAFPTQEALRSFCLAQIRDRAATRIRAVGGTGRSRALGILCELLPLDAERRLELSAQLQLGVLALTDPSLHEASATLSAGVHTACTIAIDLLDAPAPEAAAGTLHIYLDGLALHALVDPEQHTPSSVRARLDDFLTELTRA